MSSPLTESAVVLVVDDDPLTVSGIAAVLSAAGYECHGARDQAAALAAARSLALDLIICDVNLAGESGLELCRQLRKQPGMDDVPVMFTSSSQIPDIVRRSHEAGGAYYLRKPLDPEVLLELVGKALWMPHVASMRVKYADAHGPRTPAAPKLARTLEAIQGIKLPLA
ncbi:MAG TPA: response regulator [Pirellulaceae bacterium]|nr:response regulator [Pirellulaceae bacterium]